MNRNQESAPLPAAAPMGEDDRTPLADDPNPVVRVLYQQRDEALAQLEHSERQRLAAEHLLSEQESIVLGVGPISCRNGHLHNRIDVCVYCKIAELESQLADAHCQAAERGQDRDKLTYDYNKLVDELAEERRQRGEAEETVRVLRSLREGMVMVREDLQKRIAELEATLARRDEAVKPFLEVAPLIDDQAGAEYVNYILPDSNEWRALLDAWKQGE